jgi:hypothetical protein
LLNGCQTSVRDRRAVDDRPTNFDHPIFWGAFHFVGRVV